jgi:hypothetical protein
MDFDPKIAFEKDFNNIFNEVWLSRYLYDFWDAPWNETNITPGMMFRFKTAKEWHVFGLHNVNDDVINEILINKPYLVTRVEHMYAHIKISFQSIGVNTDDWKDVRNTWGIYYKINDGSYTLQGKSHFSFVQIGSV